MDIHEYMDIFGDVWKYKIDNYNEIELYHILVKKINEIEWSLCDEITEKWFVNKLETFKYYGRDIELLVSKIKIAHAKRIFGMEHVKQKYITLDDLESGFKKLKKRDDDNDNVSYINMYT